jgi:hypothetical protein
MLVYQKVHIFGTIQSIFLDIRRMGLLPLFYTNATSTNGLVRQLSSITCQWEIALIPQPGEKKIIVIRIPLYGFD